MGNYISHYLGTATPVETKDASGNTVPAPTGQPTEVPVCLPPARDEQQTTAEKAEEAEKPAETSPSPAVETAPTTPKPEITVSESGQKTVIVEPVEEPTTQKFNVTGGNKHKKRGRKH
jgi:hypothetical protein